MAKLHSVSPREITSPFIREIISLLHSKACNNLYEFPMGSFRGILLVIVINHMRGLYGIYKSRDTRAKPEWQGFINRVQT